MRLELHPALGTSEDEKRKQEIKITKASKRYDHFDCFLEGSLTYAIISRLLYIHSWLQLGVAVARSILDNHPATISERRLF